MQQLLNRCGAGGGAALSPPSVLAPPAHPTRAALGPRQPPPLPCTLCPPRLAPPWPTMDLPAANPWRAVRLLDLQTELWLSIAEKADPGDR